MTDYTFYGYARIRIGNVLENLLHNMGYPTQFAHVNFYVKIHLFYFLS